MDESKEQKLREVLDILMQFDKRVKAAEAGLKLAKKWGTPEEIAQAKREYQIAIETQDAAYQIFLHK